MGLDGVELLMALEDAFGITIDDSEAAACQTPRGVIDLFFGKLRTGDERVCVSQRAFHILRKQLGEILGIARRDITLSTDLRALISPDRQRDVWGRLKTAVQARRWPTLVRPRGLVIFLGVLWPVTFCAMIATMPAMLASVGCLTFGTASQRLTRHMQSRIPWRYSSVRALIPFVITADAVVWTRDQVAAVVKKVVIEQLGIREGEYREDADFVKDYGLD